MTTHKPFLCGTCKQGFDSQPAAENHARDKHADAKGTPIYKRVSRIEGKDFEPTYAERAVNAEIDRAMGVRNDDDWLLPDGGSNGG